jgi:hypothetical protein
MSVRPPPVPSQKSYPRVFMMQAGQDWCGDDGPRSLEGSSERGVLSQQPFNVLVVAEEALAYAQGNRS